MTISEWQAITQSQGSMHLFPLLSLIAQGGNTKTPIRYEESDDFAFFDTYFRLYGPEKNFGLTSIL